MHTHTDAPSSISFTSYSVHPNYPPTLSVPSLFDPFLCHSFFLSSFVAPHLQTIYHLTPSISYITSSHFTLTLTSALPCLLHSIHFPSLPLSSTPHFACNHELHLRLRNTSRHVTSPSTRSSPISPFYRIEILRIAASIISLISFPPKVFHFCASTNSLV